MVPSTWMQYTLSGYCHIKLFDSSKLELLFPAWHVLILPSRMLRENLETTSGMVWMPRDSKIWAHKCALWLSSYVDKWWIFWRRRNRKVGTSFNKGLLNTRAHLVELVLSSWWPISGGRRWRQIGFVGMVFHCIEKSTKLGQPGPTVPYWPWDIQRPNTTIPFPWCCPQSRSKLGSADMMERIKVDCFRIHFQLEKTGLQTRCMHSHLQKVANGSIQMDAVRINRTLPHLDPALRQQTCSPLFVVLDRETSNIPDWHSTDFCKPWRRLFRRPFHVILMGSIGPISCTP